MSRTLHSVNWLAKGAGVHASVISGLTSRAQFAFDIVSLDQEIDHESKLDPYLQKFIKTEKELSAYDLEVKDVLKFAYDRE